MTPLTVVTLILLGSCFAISISLAAVLVVVLVLGEEYPRLQAEFGPLVVSFVLFVVMTAISLLSFYTLLKSHAARYWAQALMWCGLVVTAWYYAA